MNRTLINNAGQINENTQTLPPIGSCMDALFVITSLDEDFMIMPRSTDTMYLNGVAIPNHGGISAFEPSIGDSVNVMSALTGGSSRAWFATSYHSDWSEIFGFQFQVCSAATGTLSAESDENISIDWGDGGSRSVHSGTAFEWQQQYGKAADWDVRIFGAKHLTRFDFDFEPFMYDISIDISNFPTSFEQFVCHGNNHAYGDIANLPSTMTTFACDGANTISGEITNLPPMLSSFRCIGENTISGDMTNLPASMDTFYCTGYNTITGKFTNLPAQLSYFNCTGYNTIHGDMEGVPDSVGIFICVGSNTISGDVSDIPNAATYFHCDGANMISGDIGDIPTSLNVFRCQGANTISGDLGDLPSLVDFRCCGANTISDYTSKTWTLCPGTFIFIPSGTGGLSSSEIDQLLIDFDTDLTWYSGSTITLTGTNAARTSASDTAVANMISEGATITTNP